MLGYVVVVEVKMGTLGYVGVCFGLFGYFSAMLDYYWLCFGMLKYFEVYFSQIFGLCFFGIFVFCCGKLVSIYWYLLEKYLVNFSFFCNSCIFSMQPKFLVAKIYLLKWYHSYWFPFYDVLACCNLHSFLYPKNTCVVLCINRVIPHWGLYVCLWCRHIHLPTVTGRGAAK